MNNLHDVWRTRFFHYINEVQKYMKYVFTGHMAIVLVFIIGAGGYQYSEWLKTNPVDFPSILVTAIVLGFLLAFSSPTTLIREPDQVYLLPLETKLPIYFKKALNWTFWSQILVVVIPFIIALPMLKQIGQVSSGTIGLTLVVVVFMKWWNVQVDFAFRWANRGQAVWGDRIVRVLISITVLASVLLMNVWMMIIVAIPVIYYGFIWMKQKAMHPFPYEHFVKLEQNRMLRLYRFANYFTDVPHIHGSIKRRQWLDALYKMVPFKKENTQAYLVFRTFVRTDDHFYLWVRLTAIAGIGALIINMPVAAGVFLAALAFATTIQLKQALISSTDFSMYMLYPLPAVYRKLAVHKIVRVVNIVQAIIVLICGIGNPLFYVGPVIMLIVGELTLRMTK
ncbi:ABC transporter permease [Viridibacillus arvi]|uniref:ABC transporter permease n=1 Tax=Viridibacillus arvi TaxID=263475 RepID=UPI0036F18106